MSRNIRQALGERLYPAAKTMFSEIFGQQNGILIGGAERNILLPRKPRITKVMYNPNQTYPIDLILICLSF